MRKEIRSPNIELRVDDALAVWTFGLSHSFEFCHSTFVITFGLRHSDFPSVVALHAGRHIARIARNGFA